MSRYLTFELSEGAFTALQREAAASGQTPSDLAATTLERRFGGRRSPCMEVEVDGPDGGAAGDAVEGVKRIGSPGGRGGSDHAGMKQNQGSLERFHGFVERIEGDQAFVTLESDRGGRLVGPYPMERLAASSVGEGDRFTPTAFEEGEAVRFELLLIPPEPDTPERRRRAIQEAKALLGDFDPADGGR